VGPVAAWLAGELPQGRVGVGRRTLSRALAATGGGAAARREALPGERLSAATAALTCTFPARALAEHPWGPELRPEVEVALDGAQRSRRYPGGVAPRSARVLRYRPDRDPDDADTVDAVRALLAGG
jgi:hypothetical protein